MKPRRPYPKLPKALPPLLETVKPLSEKDAAKALMLTQPEIDVLNRIASGRPMRHAQAILAAIKLKAEHTIVKKEVQPAHSVTVVVQNLPREDEEKS